VSEATRAALVEHVDVDPGKCVVIGQGPSAFPVLPHEPDTDNPYLLYVGEQFPRKNLGTLLDALEGRRLIVAGPGERGDPRAEHVGFVSPQRLAELYAGATALVLPSLDEGFGRTLLDAFARDVPAIASDIPALRELSGGAAELVPNPGDPAAWRAVLSRERQPTERGRERAKNYAWTAIAQQWNELLRSLTASTRRSSGR
jgi:glycosyltransferase involved in cell wall biosynthesis